MNACFSCATRLMCFHRHGIANMQVLLLHDIRQLHLTDTLLQAGTAHHCSTLSRSVGEAFVAVLENAPMLGAAMWYALIFAVVAAAAAAEMFWRLFV